MSKKEFILKAGSVCNASYFIEDGLVRAYTYDMEGNDVTTAFYPANAFATDLFSFFTRTPSKEYTRALTDCKTWRLTYEDMQDSFHTIPEFREFGRLHIINSYGALKERMLSVLQKTAEQRYADLMNSNPEIFQIAPLKNIASYLGVTDSSLSRIRKDFVKK
ncbi:MAG: Crp/Fnr family transcriptional regulator [Bacteroidetes bacterium]|nr:Crp/Fnr family transcriptional regulator [Bacteroidota bacterium]